MKLYFHVLSPYSQKVLVGLREMAVPFEPQVTMVGDPKARESYLKLYPLGKIPLLVKDDGGMLPESTCILEYAQTKATGPTKLFPSEPEKAQEARYYDRMVDLYLTAPMTTLFLAAVRPETRSAAEVERAKTHAHTLFQMLDARLAQHQWLAAGAFTVADVAAAPSLFYAKKLFPFSAFTNLTAYFAQLSERPVIREVQDEAAQALATSMAPKP